MPLRVVSPPSPIVLPSDIAGDHDGDDQAVARIIAAVTEEIDGPEGWLGRSLGKQTLELTGWLGGGCVVGSVARIALPCRPIIKIESVKIEGDSGSWEDVDGGTWRLANDCIEMDARASWLGQGRQHLVRYVAGYNGTTGAGEDELQTGEVPARAKQAIILAVQHLKSLQSENLYLRSMEVPDVLTETYTLSETAEHIVKRACDRLLAGLRIYSL